MGQHRREGGCGSTARRVAGAAQQGGWAGLEGGRGSLLSCLFLSPDASPCPPVPRFLPLLPPLPLIPLSYLQIFIIGPDHCPGVIVCVCGEGLG